jgi:hypothetical protein
MELYYANIDAELEQKKQSDLNSELLCWSEEERVVGEAEEG